MRGSRSKLQTSLAFHTFYILWLRDINDPTVATFAHSAKLYTNFTAKPSARLPLKQQKRDPEILRSCTKSSRLNSAKTTSLYLYLTAHK